MPPTGRPRPRTSWRSTSASSRRRPTSVARSRCARSLDRSRLTQQSLEEENALLLDRNAALEDDYRKVSSFRPLMDTYKAQLAALEASTAQLTRERDDARLELERVQERARASELARHQDSEALQLFEERVRELEAGSRTRGLNGDGGDDSTDDSLDGLGGEMDQSTAGLTMTDLKLQVRRLQRELEAARGGRAEAADGSRIVVLENLLEDARAIKARYEADYLREHRDRLVLVRQLDALRDGSTADGPEVALALRQRLNETVDELETLRKSSLGTSDALAAARCELDIAKSDLNLVGLDQIEALHKLRASVSVEKEAAETESTRLRAELVEADRKARMQLEQINGLLLDKVDLQGQSIGHREALLAKNRGATCVLIVLRQLIGQRFGLTRSATPRCQRRARGAQALKIRLAGRRDPAGGPRADCRGVGATEGAPA